MKKFFLKGLQYFLMLQASILVSMLVSLLFVIPIRFFVKNEMYQTWIFVVIGFIMEMVAITYCFYKEKIELKDVSLIKFISPCIIAFLLHTITAYFNRFYMYTAGISVSEFGIIWESYNSEYMITNLHEVELFRLIIPFVINIIFRISAVFLSYYLGKRKIDKTKQEFANEL